VSAAKAFISMANVHGKSGALQGPAESGVAASEHRNGAHLRSLQLAGQPRGR
jgi:hypothetical protein